MSPNVDFDKRGVIDIVADEFMSNVLPFPVPAVNNWCAIQVAVVPWEGEFKRFAWSPVGKLIDFWSTIGEDLTLSCFPVESTFTIRAWIIVVGVFYRDVVR